MLRNIGVKATGHVGELDPDLAEKAVEAGKKLDEASQPSEQKTMKKIPAYSGPLSVKRSDDPKVTLCMIMKNEEEHIGRCLQSLIDHVDFVVINDTGSTDKSMEIARSFGEKVTIIENPWEKDFSKARNQAMEVVTTEWIIQLDCDEEMDPESAKNIRDVVKSAHKDATCNLVYCTLVNKELNSNDPNDEISVINTGKIMRMGVGTHYRNRIHNRLVVDGNSRITGLRIVHYGYNLDPETMKAKAIRTTELLLTQHEELPDDPETPYYLSIQYMRASDWDNCLKYAIEALEKFEKHEPGSQLILLCYHIQATVHYHRKDFDESIRCCKAALDIYPSYLDSNGLLSSIYFATKQYDNCYKQTMRYFACCDMLKKDPSKSLVIPMNTLKNEWIMNVQLAINFYEQADSAQAVKFLARGEELLKPEDKYKASFEVFKYLFSLADEASKNRAEAIYKSGFRPG